MSLLSEFQDSQDYINIMKTKCSKMRNVTEPSNFAVHHKIHSSEKQYEIILYIIPMCCRSL